MLILNALYYKQRISPILASIKFATKVIKQLHVMVHVISGLIWPLKGVRAILLTLGIQTCGMPRNEMCNHHVLFSTSISVSEPFFFCKFFLVTTPFDMGSLLVHTYHSIVKQSSCLALAIVQLTIMRCPYTIDFH